ncbi:MAG: mucoidy inhibitor MuiA family protein [Microcoleaceae cyanobacterium]
MTNSEKIETKKIVNTEISQVTVYTDRARITRRGNLEVSGNEQELVITELPVTLEADSVRVTGAGKVAVQLLGVRTEQVFKSELITEKLADLTQQIQDSEAQKRYVEDQIKAQKMQVTFVEDLSKKSVAEFSNSLAKRQIGLSETTELIGFLGQRYSEYSGAVAYYEKQLQELDKKLNFLYQELQELENHSPLESCKVTIKIAVEESGDFQLEISYLVSQAGWKPVYDLAAISESDRVNITYLAEIKQTTGEDWENINLTLSTAKPEITSLPPQLEPWYIDVPPQQAAQFPVMAMAAVSMNQAKLESTNGVINQEKAVEISPIEEEIATQTAMATILKSGSFVTFELEAKNHIPSDGAAHKVIIFNDDYPSYFQFVAIPKLISFVYQQAIITNPHTGVTLLPGKINIFRDQIFIGTTQLEHIVPGQQFKVNLGVNEGFSIERELVEREVDKKLIGNHRRTTYAYRLQITNLNEIETTLILQEQIPVSRDERIKIQLTQIYPKIQTSQIGLLEWELILQPQSTQEVYYQFVVENPPELTVVGLNI